MDYKCKRWARLRDRVLKRDNYLCQYYLRYGRMVTANTVHHIYPAAEFPEYQWCEWNLISLSSEAHNMMHTRDGDELTAEGKRLQDRLRRKGIVDESGRYIKK